MSERTISDEEGRKWTVAVHWPVSRRKKGTDPVETVRPTIHFRSEEEHLQTQRNIFGLDYLSDDELRDLLQEAREAAGE